ncbi:MAG: J domain-containing protein [Lachnospiraceae bacterium]|nr:J domain-containing protein [Lachnospiraceae bacterium]
MKYFKDVRTLEDLRRQYKELLKKYHPDNANGSTAATQEINAEYDRLFKVLKDQHESTADSTAHKESSYNANIYDWENDKALREVLQKIINFDGIEIEIVGAWLWVSGNTYSYKKELKEIGFKWANTKKQWYYHTEAYRKKSRKSLSMDDIRNYYGSTKVQTDTRILLEA